MRMLLLRTVKPPASVLRLLAGGAGLGEASCGVGSSGDGSLVKREPRAGEGVAAAEAGESVPGVTGGDEEGGELPNS